MKKIQLWKYYLCKPLILKKALIALFTTDLLYFFTISPQNGRTRSEVITAESRDDDDDDDDDDDNDDDNE